MNHYDVVIIGAGIAGASLASEIAKERSVLLLEAEDMPGYHATGRSAAFWTESYGGPKVQPLTSASRHFLEYPAPDFAERSFLKPRGSVTIGHDRDAALAAKFLAQFAGSGVAMTPWDDQQLHRVLPHLRPGWGQAIYEPDCRDIDVAALHGAYLRDAKRKSASLLCRAAVNAISRSGEKWRIVAGGGEYSADLLINAAGAWADNIAEMAQVTPIGITPYIRNMVQIECDPPSTADLPLVIAHDGSFYFKPESGGSYWLSPHDEIPSPPGDVAPDELSVATAISRFESVLDVTVTRVSRKWAGLRSFAPDRLPVIGFDPSQPQFFWFAGQGGFGIQTAPAAAMLARSIILEQAAADDIHKVDAKLYAPSRFVRER